jgi:hypothetical protein
VIILPYSQSLTIVGAFGARHLCNSATRTADEAFRLSRRLSAGDRGLAAMRLARGGASQRRREAVQAAFAKHHGRALRVPFSMARRPIGSLRDKVCVSYVWDGGAPRKGLDHADNKSMSVPFRWQLHSISVMALLLMVSASADGQVTASRRNSALPPGFRVLDDTFWEGPWVFSSVGSSPSALPRLHNSRGERVNGPVPFRLDDGSTGTLRVRSDPSEPCGSAADICLAEIFWIDIEDEAGGTVAHWRLSAAYGVFDLVPIDLVDGSGDELVIVRIPGHASPPLGIELRIWKLGATVPVDLVEPLRVAGYLDTVERAVPCVRWRVHLLLDPLVGKPRRISLVGEFAVEVDPSDPTWSCHLNRRGANGAAALRRGENLRFSDGRYRLRANRGTTADLLRIESSGDSR